ncbi:MAG: hypothetical protein MUC78_14230 [Bacteroidales bacterium]|nr:hypothetical protein [Bacteroidales bacterium]
MVYRWEGRINNKSKPRQWRFLFEAIPAGILRRRRNNPISRTMIDDYDAGVNNRGWNPSTDGWNPWQSVTKVQFQP